MSPASIHFCCCQAYQLALARCAHPAVPSARRQASEASVHMQICIRGANVFKGYFKDEAQTRDCIDSDGWLHSGDIGMWLPGGRLKIIDRKKNIFKLAQASLEPCAHSCCS